MLCVLQTVFVCEAFVELLEKACQGRPALDVRHSAMSSVTRNSSALQIFQVSGHDKRQRNPVTEYSLFTKLSMKNIQNYLQK